MSLVDLGKRLLDSAKHGETEEVRQLMTNGAPFTTDWLGTSPLHMAAQFGHVQTAEVLLRAGISRDARTKVDRTPLHVAAQEGHLEIVELLIKHGADIEAKDMLRMTPLHWAVERGHAPVIQFLLDNGADANAISKFGKSSADIAEDKCRADLMHVLWEYASNNFKSNETLDTKPSDLNTPTSPESLQGISSAEDRTSPAAKASPVTASFPSANKPIALARSTITQSGPVLTTSTTTSSATTLSAKATSSQPILLQANLTHLQKAAVPVAGTKPVGGDSEEGDASDQSCTNVLTTLAALAEATAPNATISTSEALQWLETHGITMLPADNTTIVASALEGGQTFSLTEAGKLALSWVKEQQNLEGATAVVTTAQDNTTAKTLQSIANSQNQKVITIVADQSQLPSIINVSSQSAPVVVVSNQNVQTSNKEQPAKRPRLTSPSRELSKPTPNGKVITSTEDAVLEERLKLQRELEEVRRQAEAYRAQLQQKEHEAEQYRKQLEQMRTTSQK